jgi:outer membrane lipoprotein-sorting protein
MEVPMGARALVISALCLFAAPLAFAQTDPESMLRNMKPSWKKVTDFTAEMHKQELYGSKLSPEEKINIKFAKPFKVYLKYLTAPYKGREALYQGKDWNGGEIKATNGTFPNVTVNLAIYGKAAMKDQHHPVTHVGFDFAIKNTIKGLDDAKAANELDIKTTGSDTVDGRSCTKIEVKFNAKAGQEVQTVKGDTWFSLSDKYGIDYYVLLHNNDGKKLGKDKIWVPKYYGSKQEYCIDDSNGLPIKSSTWDHNGKLYETYSYFKFKTNVGLKDLDFDAENSEYDF